MITIKHHSDTSIQVGEKIVYKDANGKWVSASELTTAEHNAFVEGLKAIGETLVD